MKFKVWIAIATIITSATSLFAADFNVGGFATADRIIAEFSKQVMSYKFFVFGEEYCSNCGGRPSGIASDLANISSIDGSIKKVNQDVAVTLAQARAKIDARISRMQREADQHELSLNQNQESLHKLSEDLAISIEKTSAKVERLNPPLLPGRTTRLQDLIQSRDHLLKLEEQITQRVPEALLPVLPTGDVLVDQQAQTSPQRPFELRPAIRKEQIKQSVAFMAARERVIMNLSGGHVDPVFESLEHFDATRALAQTYLFYADQMSQNPALNPMLVGVSTAKLAENLYHSALTLRLVAQGSAQGVWDTTLSLVEGVKGTYSAIKNYAETCDKIVELFETFEPVRVQNAITRFLTSQWNDFQNGDAYTRSRMVGRLLSEIGLAFINPTRFAGSMAVESTRLGSSLAHLGRSVAPLSIQGSNFLVEIVNDTRMILRNNAGAIGDLSRGVSEVEAIKQTATIIESAAKLGAKTGDTISSFAQSFKSNPKAIKKIEEITTNIGKSPSALKAIEQTPFGRPAFYVNAEGKVLPATAYRHIGADQKNFVEQIIKEGKIPARPGSGNYVTFERFENAAEASSTLQVPHDATYRVTLDTIENINDLRIPYGEWGKADWLEPFTKAYPDYGVGGASQAVTNSAMSGILEIKNLVTGEILFKR